MTTLVVGILAATSPAADAGGVEVAGGRAAVSRLLDGLDTDPTRFVASLNRRLLDSVNGDGRWQDHPRRDALVTFDRVVRALRSRHGGTLELTPDTAGRAALADIASDLGYNLGEDLRLVRREDDGAVELRAVARALDWDLALTAVRLDQGETIRLELPLEVVPTTVGLDGWGAIAGVPVDPDAALEILARDERLGLALAALDRVDAATRTVLLADVVPDLDRSTAARLFRYGAALEVRDARVVPAGGADAAVLWEEVVGRPLDDPGAFIASLLASRDGAAAALWHALWFADPAAASGLLGRWRADGAWPEGVLDALERMRMVAGFDRPRGAGPGPLSVLQALTWPLPGSPPSWATAVCGDTVPSGTGELETLASDRPAADPLLAAWRCDGVSSTAARDAARRLIRVAGMSRDHPAAAAPEQQILVGRLAVRHGPGLLVVDRLAPEGEGAVRDLLLAAMTMDRMQTDAEGRAVIGAFQGGGELLAALAQGGRVGHPDLEELAADWGRRHAVAWAPQDLARYQTRWLAELARALPPAPDGVPGRGPAERALLAALAGPPGTVRFRWQGLDYSGDRASARARAMAIQLERFRVPSLDAAADAVMLLDRLRKAIDRDAEAEVSVLSRELIDLVEHRLPPPFPDGAHGGAGCRAASDRRALLQELHAVADEGPRRARRRLDVVATEVAAELRPLLLAAPFLVGLAEDVDNPFVEQRLVCGHTLTRNIAGPFAAAAPWMSPVVVPSDGARSGPSLSGHLGGVAGALIRFRAAGAEVGAAGADALATMRDRRFWRVAAAGDWWRVDGPTAGGGVAAIELGGVGVEGVLLGGDRVHPRLEEAVRRTVPAGRLERAADSLAAGGGSRSTITRGERLRIGLAVAETLTTSARAGLEEPVGTFERACREIGAGWRSALDAVGPPTPALDGRGRRHLGGWPPFEAIESEGDLAALHDRELIELTLLVVEYSGRRGLPGEVTGDLMRRLVLRAAGEAPTASPRDWEGYLGWLDGITDEELDTALRGCLEDGLYRASGL